MSVSYSTWVHCDCECKTCTPGECDGLTQETQDEGDAVYAAGEGWVTVDANPADGEGVHYCASCAKTLGVEDEV